MIRRTVADIEEFLTFSGANMKKQLMFSKAIELNPDFAGAYYGNGSYIYRD